MIVDRFAGVHIGGCVCEITIRLTHTAIRRSHSYGKTYYLEEYKTEDLIASVLHLAGTSYSLLYFAG